MSIFGNKIFEKGEHMETMLYQQGFKLGLQFKQIVELVLQLSKEQRDMLVSIMENEAVIRQYATVNEQEQTAWSYPYKGILDPKTYISNTSESWEGIVGTWEGKETDMEVIEALKTIS